MVSTEAYRQLVTATRQSSAANHSAPPVLSPPRFVGRELERGESGRQPPADGSPLPASPFVAFVPFCSISFPLDLLLFCGFLYFLRP